MDLGLTGQTAFVSAASSRGIGLAVAKTGGKDPEDVLKEMAFEVPMGRLGLAEELAKFVTFLCSPVCSYLTGAVIQVDGGLYHALI
jgi:3-oxoacyl-[acyl-carrier protein] reductase